MQETSAINNTHLQIGNGFKPGKKSHTSQITHRVMSQTYQIWYMIYLITYKLTAYFNSISPKKVFGGPLVFEEYVLWLCWLSFHPDFSTWPSWKIWFYSIELKIHISTNPTLKPSGSLQPHMVDPETPKGLGTTYKYFPGKLPTKLSIKCRTKQRTHVRFLEG